MTITYELMYLVGLKPWETAGEAGKRQFSQLLSSIEDGRDAPFGRALDLGCGTGIHTLELAARGWQATGVDDVGRAVRQARDRGGSAEFLVGDVTRLPELQLAPFDLFLDIGCFHGLSAADQVAMGRGVTDLANPGASLLMMAFQPHRPNLPPGQASQAEIETAYAGWELVSTQAADPSVLPRQMVRAAPTFYTLRLR